MQLISVLLDRDLQIVNCHASTETSDLLGGLRPLRGRKQILERLIKKMRDVSSEVAKVDLCSSVAIPEYLKSAEQSIVPESCATEIMTISRKLREIIVKNTSKNAMPEKRKTKSKRHDKRRKLANGGAEEVSSGPEEFCSSIVNMSFLKKLLDEVDSLQQQYTSLFEWVDGPLVRAMRKGDLFLLDEMSLADDAVLERLNSVLEPSRTLVLAEKGGDLSEDEDSNESTEIKANENFRVFATMNPGGDFGKRELSVCVLSIAEN